MGGQLAHREIGLWPHREIVRHSVHGARDVYGRLLMCGKQCQQQRRWHSRNIDGPVNFINAGKNFAAGIQSSGHVIFDLSPPGNGPGLIDHDCPVMPLVVVEFNSPLAMQSVGTTERPAPAPAAAVADVNCGPVTDAGGSTRHVIAVGTAAGRVGCTEAITVATTYVTTVAPSDVVSVDGCTCEAQPDAVVPSMCVKDALQIGLCAS